MAGLSLNCGQNYSLYYTCASYHLFFCFFFVSGFLGWLTIGVWVAVRVGVASGDFGWGVLPVVMLAHSLRSVASITTGYSEATLRVGGAIGGERGIGGDRVGGFGRDYYII